MIKSFVISLIRSKNPNKRRIKTDNDPDPNIHNNTFIDQYTYHQYPSEKDNENIE